MVAICACCLQFGGTIHIVDDCTFSVTNFTYDGGGPSVYWYGAPNAGSTSLECAALPFLIVNCQRGSSVCLVCRSIGLSVEQGNRYFRGELAIFRNDGDVIVGGGEVQAGSGDNVRPITHLIHASAMLHATSRDSAQ